MTEQKTYTVEYNSNNSGGQWWLSDKDWKRLEEAGWTVNWGGLDFCHDDFPPIGGGESVAPNTHEKRECPGHRRSTSYAEAKKSGDRWLGAMARDAYIEIEAYSSTLAEGVAEAWFGDALPNQDPQAEGCNCCGRPHSFWAREKATVPA